MSENFLCHARWLTARAPLRGFVRVPVFFRLHDNFVRNMLAILILFRLGESGAGPLVTLAVGIFMAPSLLLSGIGGEMADAHDKAWLARRLKFAEVLVQIIAAAGLFLSSLPLLYTALFGLGVTSALFGPVKYGILPDLLAKHELMAGNALVGLIAGGLTAKGRAPEGTVLQLMAIATAYFVASLFTPSVERAAPGLRANPNVLASNFALVREVAEDAKLWARTLAVSWFWMSGAVALSLVPIVVRNKASRSRRR